MPKFRKKPVVIEAELVATLCASAEKNWKALPKWVEEAYERGDILFISRSEGLSVRTLEGHMHAKPNDMLIRGVRGEIYPCKPDIFDATYERADEDFLPQTTSGYEKRGHNNCGGDHECG